MTRHRRARPLRGLASDLSRWASGLWDVKLQTAKTVAVDAGAVRIRRSWRAPQDPCAIFQLVPAEADRYPVSVVLSAQ